MPDAVSRTVLPFVLDALAASQVGTWDYDITSGIMCGDPNMARLFGHTAAVAEAGLPFKDFCRGVNRDDNARAEPLREQLREQGGVLLFELRVTPTPGITRWLMIRGAFERQADGGMRARGIAIDVTGSQVDGDIKGGSIITADIGERPSPLDEVTSHAIAARNAVVHLGEPERSVIQPPADSLLLTIGRAIARRMGAAKR